MTVDGETCGSAAGRGGVIGLRNASRCIKFKDSIKMDKIRGIAEPTLCMALQLAACR
jgi:hypothetical protein